MIAWYHEPLFYALDAVDLAVLFAIGVLWSGGVWATTEAIKDRLAVPKPYPRRYRACLAWLPVAASGLACVWAFPLALHGVGQDAPHTADMAAASLCVGIIGGLGAKGAHDMASGIMRAAYDRVTALVRGGNNGSGR